MTIPQIEENIQSMKHQLAALTEITQGLETNLSMLRKQLDVNQDSPPASYEPYVQKR